MGDFEVESSISSAVSEGDFAKTCQLLTGKGYFSVLAVGGSLLLSACRIGQCEIVELILHMSHLNVNEHYDSTTALAEACKYGHHECAKLLLRHHADPDIGSGYYREPPLYSASDSGHFLCVKALLEGGANPDLPDKEGSNSAFIAAHQNHPDILELLCEYGGDMNLGTREFNVTPLYIAAQNGFTEAVNLLLTKGNANPNIARTRDNATPLFTATLVGHITTAERLVDAHADVNFPSKNGTTPFHIACLRGIETLVEKMIVYASADVNYPRIGDGATPLHIATRAGRVNIVKLLLKYHADVNKKSASFVTPLQVAQAEKSSVTSSHTFYTYCFRHALRVTSLCR